MQRLFLHGTAPALSRPRGRAERRGHPTCPRCGRRRGRGPDGHGRWTPGGGCDRALRFQLAGNTLRMVTPDGRADLRRVLERHAAGIATVTTSSTPGVPRGTRWMRATGMVSLKNLGAPDQVRFGLRRIDDLRPGAGRSLRLWRAPCAAGRG